MAMRKVEERLEEAGSDDRSAWFTSALAVAWPGGPAVVVLHGASGAKDQFTFVEFSRRLAAAGMVVYTVDYLSGTSSTLNVSLLLW